MNDHLDNDEIVDVKAGDVSSCCDLWSLCVVRTQVMRRFRGSCRHLHLRLPVQLHDSCYRLRNTKETEGDKCKSKKYFRNLTKKTPNADHGAPQRHSVSAGDELIAGLFSTAYVTWFIGLENMASLECK